MLFLPDVTGTYTAFIFDQYPGDPDHWIGNNHFSNMDHWTYFTILANI